MRRLDGNASVRLLDQCPELETPGQRSDRILRIDDLLLGLCRGESADLCGPVRHGRISGGWRAGGRGERTRRCTRVFRFGILDGMASWSTIDSAVSPYTRSTCLRRM